MGRGHTAGLVVYSLAMVRVWRERGFADTTETLIAEFAPDAAALTQAEAAAAGLLPSWVGDEELHLSHRSNLLAKDLRQLSAFLDEMAPGDLVGLPIERGAGLLLGEVVGDYLFAGRELLPHRRPARFSHVVARSAARPPATLQDPRALFRITLDPEALPAGLR